MNYSPKAAGRFVVARGQPAKLLEATEKAFDFVVVAVEVTGKQTLAAVLLAEKHGIRPDRSNYD
jgi:hypothetical protein